MKFNHFSVPPFFYVNFKKLKLERLTDMGVNLHNVINLIEVIPMDDWDPKNVRSFLKQWFIMKA